MVLLKLLVLVCRTICRPSLVNSNYISLDSYLEARQAHQPPITHQFLITDRRALHMQKCRPCQELRAGRFLPWAEQCDQSHLSNILSCCFINIGKLREGTNDATRRGISQTEDKLLDFSYWIFHLSYIIYPRAHILTTLLRRRDFRRILGLVCLVFHHGIRTRIYEFLLSFGRPGAGR